MQIKLLLLLSFSGLGLLVGNVLYKKEQEQELYFIEVKSLINSLICDIKFSQKNICEIVLDFDTKSRLLVLHKKQFIQGTDNNELCLEKDWLTQNQYQAIKNLFENLGKYDVHTQIFQLESSREKIELLASDGMIVKRPILITKKGVYVGFKEEEWKKIV